MKVATISNPLVAVVVFVVVGVFLALACSATHPATQSRLARAGRRSQGKNNNNKSLGYQNLLYRNATQRAVGSVIPWPREIKFLNGLDYLAIDPADFRLRLADEIKDCEIVQRAVARYAGKLLFDDVKPEDKDDPTDGRRKKLGSLQEIELTRNIAFQFECQSMPDENMEEFYSVGIMLSSQGRPPVAELSARTSWGLIRGLETISQLIFNMGPAAAASQTAKQFGIQPVLINDWPRFDYRAFMLDTARHYISMPKIMDLLDAMAFNKMNVFHWHLVDDQSFPFESSVYPQLSKRSSFRPNMIYTHADVKSVVRYAADRGIRVVPELDTPGHTYALRHVPNLLTQCYNKTTGKPDGDLGPIDPTKNGSYKAVGKLIDELGSLFPDNYFHAGGDEVEFDCWQSNPDVNQWMDSRNISGKYHELSNYYIRRLQTMLTKRSKTMVTWQEVFDDGANLPKDAIVHVWKFINDRPAYMAELKAAVTAGYRAILSSCWYLNYIDYGEDWVKFYQCDPISGPIKEQEAHLVLGGEVCMWSEYVDDTNVVSRTWPRASAAAERLWSSQTKTNVGEFLTRLEQIRCRMLFRGIQAEPVNGPGYC